VTSEGVPRSGERDGDAGWGDDAPAPGDSHPAFDTSIAHQARIYDYLLGGKDNFAADRKAGDAMIAAYPTMVGLARANRVFLGRAVRYLTADAGIRQFLDIGTGIPTAGNTHQVAQEIAPETRVVYVDYDPVVLSQARALLTSSEQGATDYIDADARNTEAILEKAARTLDFSQPVAVMLVMILHAIGDSDDPYGIATRVMAAVPAGSYLTISHPAADIEPEKVANVTGSLNELSYQKYTTRTHSQVMRFFDGLDLVDPGLVQVQQWRPGIERNQTAAVWAGVGHKPRD